MSRTPEENEVRRSAEIEAGESIGHTHIMSGSTMDDICSCSCGWKSVPYWDGKPYAYADWVQHIKEQGAAIAY